jgi:hypothetical protein
MQIARILLVLSCLSAVAFGETNHDQAKAAFLSGVERFRQEDWAGALTDFEASYRLNPLPEVLFNIALAEEHLGRRADALEALTRYERDAEARGALTPARRADAERRVADLKQGLAMLTIVVVPADAQLVVDGSPRSNPVYLESGVHAIDARAPGFAAAHREVDVSAGMAYEVRVALDAAPAQRSASAAAPISASRSTRPRTPRFLSTGRGQATLALGLTGGALLIAGAVLGGRAIALHDQYHTGCPPSCEQAIYDRGRNNAIAADVLLSIGGASAVAALLVAVIPASRRRVIATRAGVGLAF